MEATPKPVQQTTDRENEKKKLTFGQKFMHFLMYGGFIVLLIAAVVIVILVEKLLK